MPLRRGHLLGKESPMKRIMWLGLMIFLSIPLPVLAEDREVENSEGVIVYLEALPLFAKYQ